MVHGRRLALIAHEQAWRPRSLSPFRGEVSPRVIDSRFVDAPPHPDLLPRRSGLPDLRIIDAEVGQARLRVGGEGAQAPCQKMPRGLHRKSGHDGKDRTNEQATLPGLGGLHMMPPRRLSVTLACLASLLCMAAPRAPAQSP